MAIVSSVGFWLLIAVGGIVIAGAMLILEKISKIWASMGIMRDRIVLEDNAC
jgi:hypothetical protein